VSATPPAVNRDELLDALRELLLGIAHQRTVEDTVRMCVDRLAARPNAVLVGIWLIDDQAKRLRLAASAGPRGSGREQWTNAGADYRTAAVGDGTIGTIAASAEPRLVEAADDPFVTGDPTWMHDEGVVTLMGAPIIHAETVLGVITALMRVRVDEDAQRWLRVVTDFAAASIANARAFDEIQQLRHRLELENEYLQTEVLDAGSFTDIIGTSAGITSVLERIAMVAPTDSNVLILGESGTGKELVAREIHKHSQRAGRPMIRVNCAAIPEELFESEFFGHVRGAFTGAMRDRAGRFELADKGTIFLDEVSEIPTTVQAKLLRILQERELERVGDERTRTVDVRVIAASNRDLKAAVDAGAFRDDLYYRLNVFPIELPALRERKEDIAPIAAAFVAQAARRVDRPVPALSVGLVEQLCAYDWPGNVRELQNVLERAMIVSRGGPLRLDVAPTTEGGHLGGASIVTESVVSDAEIKKRERENVLAALERTSWRVYGPKGAAKLLGLAPSTLLSRMQRMGIKRPG
jgi:transcriptional regulator with GAF, ATPase, and Fis domain